MSEQISNGTLFRFSINTMISAIERGDFAEAAQEQQRLRELGWHVSREAPRPRPRRNRDGGRDGSL